VVLEVDITVMAGLLGGFGGREPRAVYQGAARGASGSRRSCRHP